MFEVNNNQNTSGTISSGLTSFRSDVYFHHRASSRSAAYMTGYSLTPSEEKVFRLPVFNEDGSIFGGSIYRIDFVTTIPGNTLEGSLVEYVGADNQSTYGVITEPRIFAKYRGAYVTPISKSYKQALLSANPKLAKITLTEADLVPLPKALLDKVDVSFLDKIDSPILKKVCSYKPFTGVCETFVAARIFAFEMLLWIYFGLLLVVLLIIIILYTHS